MTDEEVFFDLVTGHASARFVWVDARAADDLGSGHPAAVRLPLAELLAGAPIDVPAAAELVVFGSGQADTQQAAEVLARRGYRVLAAPDGLLGLRRLRLA